MKSLVKTRREPGLWLQDTPVPQIGAADVLIRIKRMAICGTDLHIFNWDKWAQATIPVPMVTGHEYLGTIEALGADVRGLRVGQRVSGEGHIVCGHCRNCRAGRGHLCRNTLGVGVNRPGSFCEFLSLPASNVYPIPDDIPDDIAAILDPLGNAVHTALSFDLIGEDVLITGAGPIGLMAVAICRHVGARHIVITDINDFRLSLAVRLGATRAVRADREKLREVMDAIGMKEGFDVGLEMSGAPVALRSMISAMNHGGNHHGRCFRRLGEQIREGAEAPGDGGGVVATARPSELVRSGHVGRGEHVEPGQYLARRADEGLAQPPELRADA